MSYKIHKIFPETFYQASNIIDDKYRIELVEFAHAIEKEMTDVSHIWDCTIKTSYLSHNLCLSDKCKKLIETFSLHVNKYLQELGILTQYIFTNGWINISEKHNYQEQHGHSGSMLSLIYYLDIPNNSGNTVFKKIYETQRVQSTELNSLNAITHKVEAKTNDLVIFPSYMPHFVTKNKSHDKRLTMSFNTREVY